MNRYRIRYIWTDDPKALRDRVADLFAEWKKDIEAPTPTSAINQFHKFVQQVREMATDRVTVLRPKLRHDQYRVVSMHQFYHDAALHKNPSAQPIIESRIDYPNSPNPLLHPDGAGHNEADKASKGYEEFDFGPDSSKVSLDDEFQGATD